MATHPLGHTHLQSLGLREGVDAGEGLPRATREGLLHQSLSPVFLSQRDTYPFWRGLSWTQQSQD